MEVEEQIMGIAKQYDISFKDGVWKQSGAHDGRDAVWEQDPWARAPRKNDVDSLSEARQKMDKVEVRSIFADQDGNQLPRKQLADLAASLTGPAVVCIPKGNLLPACEAARRRKAPVVLLLKDEVAQCPDDAVATKMQLVTRSSPSSFWKASQWQCLTFGEVPVEVTLEGVEVALPDEEAVQMIAELREDQVESSEFQKFLRADNLEGSIGLTPAAFPVNSSKVWGKAPSRVAVKKAVVVAKNIKYVFVSER